MHSPPFARATAAASSRVIRLRAVAHIGHHDPPLTVAKRVRHTCPSAQRHNNCDVLSVHAWDKHLPECIAAEDCASVMLKDRFFLAQIGHQLPLQRTLDILALQVWPALHCQSSFSMLDRYSPDKHNPSRDRARARAASMPSGGRPLLGRRTSARSATDKRDDARARTRADKSMP